MLEKKSYQWSLIFIFIISLLISMFYIRMINNDKKYKIGATYMNMDNSFYDAINEEVEKVVSRNGDKLYLRDPGLNSEKQVQQVYDLIKLKIDLLIINPIDIKQEKMIKALKQAKEKGIKIVVVDSPINNENNYLANTTIVSDNYNAGVLLAKKMMKDYKKASILLIKHQSALSAVDRINGFKDTIKNHPQYQIVDESDSGGQTEKAMSNVRKAIRKQIYFDVVMALNDPTALGALAAIDEAKINHQMCVYSVDGSPNLKGLILDNRFPIITCAQHPLIMGKQAIDSGYQLLKGKKIKNTMIKVDLITKDNINLNHVTGWQ